MAKIDTHCEDCKKVLGDEFRYVHNWLDEYAKQYNPFIHLEYHRKFRHHNGGVKQIKIKWGHYAAQAAKLHIIRDQQEYVYFNIDTMREDDIDRLFEQALKFCHPEDVINTNPVS